MYVVVRICMCKESRNHKILCKLFVQLFGLNMCLYIVGCESQSHKGPPTSKLNSETVSVLPFLHPFLIFLFHLLPSPVHPTGFSFYFLPSLLAIFILLSSINNNNLKPQDNIFVQLFGYRQLQQPLAGTSQMLSCMDG